MHGYLNKSTEDDTTEASVVAACNIKLDAYDWNYYSLEDIILQYKKSNQQIMHIMPLRPLLSLKLEKRWG